MLQSILPIFAHLKNEIAQTMNLMKFQEVYGKLRESFDSNFPHGQMQNFVDVINLECKIFLIFHSKSRYRCAKFQSTS